MYIGIISDTHDHHKNVIQAINIFNEQKVEYVLHAGDIVSPFTASAFSQLEKVKFIAVFGNNEGEKLFLKTTIENFGGRIYEYCYKGIIADKKIYMAHTPHNVEEIAKSQEYDLLIYGHTHKQDIRRIGRTLIINPGECTDWLTGQGYIVILNPDDMSYQIETVG